MTRFVVAQIAGVALLVLGGQGLVRLVFNHADGGLVRFLPGGFPIWVVVNIVLLVVGIGLASWGQRCGAGR